MVKIRSPYSIDLLHVLQQFPVVKTTKYFEEQVLRKRPYIKKSWCAQAILRPLAKEIQADGRIRYWGRVAEFENRIIRVITLEDGVTIHNAFPDRNFQVGIEFEGKIK